MKLHQHIEPDLNIITGYGEGHVLVNRERHDGGLIVSARRIIAPWACGGWEGLSTADIQALAELGAEVVLLGTGSRQRFPSPALLRPLIDARIGFEIMDLAAACRTYNILVGEARAVAVGLMHDQATSGIPG